MADYVGMKYSREWYEEQVLETLAEAANPNQSTEDRNSLGQRAIALSNLATTAPTMEYPHG